MAVETVLAPHARLQPANPAVDTRGNGCHQPDGGVLQSIFSFKTSGGSLQITSSVHNIVTVPTFVRTFNCQLMII